MAGAASGEEENYWPGYVDALTTMLMVLTFVMMVLGVVVFTLSQNVSKNAVASLAAEVDIDTTKLEQSTPDSVRAAVVAALKDRLARREQSSPSAAPAKAETPPPVSEPSEATAFDVAALPPNWRPGETRSAAPPASDASPAQQKIEAQPDRLPTAPEVVARLDPAPPRPAAVGPTREIVQSEVVQAPEPKAETDSGVTGAGLRIVFKNGAVQLDQAGAAELDAYARSSGSAFMVRASAFVANSGATDARRRAYYRGMLVRERLIQLGVKANQIIVNVRDDGVESQDVVQVIARQAARP